MIHALWILKIFDHNNITTNLGARGGNDQPASLAHVRDVLCPVHLKSLTPRGAADVGNDLLHFGGGASAHEHLAARGDGGQQAQLEPTLDL